MPNTYSTQEFQNNFSRYLLQDDPAQHHELQQWLTTEIEDQGVAPGLLIYRNNFIHSVSQALKALYPGIALLVGDSYFSALARDFIIASPPQDPVLSLYGSNFSDFIQQHPACQSLPWLVDVAKFEWFNHIALHAADDPELSVASMAELEPERLIDLIFRIHSSVTLMQSQWPIHEIYRQVHQPEPKQVSMPAERVHCLLIYRRQLHTQIVELQSEAYLLLQALQQGNPLAKAWEKTQSASQIPDSELTPMLVYLLELGVFSSHFFETNFNKGTNSL